MTTNTTTKNVPASALSFRCGEFEFADAPANANPLIFPFTMRARSADVISHPYWGRIVHDMSGMTLRKPTCPIDYCHFAECIIGVGESFAFDDKGLTVTGQLVALSADSNDRAFEVATKAKNKVPYEASIDWRGPGILIEEVGEGATTECNGQTLTGPVTVVRKWPLRSVAVTPYGQDSDTSTEFSESQKDDEKLVSVCLFFESGEPTVSTKTDPTPKPETATGLSLDTLKQFNDAFGPKASDFLLAGLTFDQANLKFKDERLSALETENKQLKEQSVKLTEAATEAAKKLADDQKALAEKVLGDPNPIATDPAKGAGKKKFADMFRVAGSK